MKKVIDQVKTKIHIAFKALKHFYECKHKDQTIVIGDKVLLYTKNLKLPDICKFQPWFMVPFWVTSTESATYCLDLPPNMAAVHPWFHANLLKPVQPHPAGLPMLEGDSDKVEAILQINKHGKHANMKCLGYSSSYNQWIKLSELRVFTTLAPEVVKTFVRGKQR